MVWRHSDEEEHRSFEVQPQVIQFHWFVRLRIFKYNVINILTLVRYIGHWVPMVALIALAFVEHDQQVLAVALLTLAVGFNAATFLGYQVSGI